jgi:integrase/recombinase XerD
MARPVSRVCNVKVAGPLAPFVDAYRAELRERGYTPLSSVNELRQVGRVSRWLDANSLPADSLTRERVEEFVAEHRARRDGAYCSLQGLVCLLDVLRGLGVLETERPAPPSGPSDVLLASFARYLLAERGLAACTTEAYVTRARRFLDGRSGDQPLVELTASEVTRVVLRESTAVSAGSAQYFVAALRSFLRFCFIEGLVKLDLSQAALPVTGRRRSSLPTGISRADARALLGGCDRRLAIGRRDYAVILTLLRLGLRASEVATLTLDGIDWRAAEIVVAGKGGRVDRLPLPPDVGAAIAAYLRRGRPSCDRREVFLRALAPIGPLGRGGISTLVRRACRRAGIDPTGAHRLRHTAACEMVSGGVPLQHIGQVLRHRSPVSTAIYARVDLERLRRLAQPWPGGQGR